MSELLEVYNLKKYFDTKYGTLHAVEDISFKLSQGKTLGLVGESGCGKSTLGRVILQLIPKTSGQVLLEGEDVTEVSPARLRELRAKMQMIFQDPFSSIDPRKSVSQTIGEPLKIRKSIKNDAEYQDKVRELMDIVGLARRYEGSYPHELDGGRRQRIGIARALAMDPKFIVCDEPVSALDVSIQAQILNLMKDLQKERNFSYLFITHDLSVVRHIADEILVMYLGTMVEKSDAKELFKKNYHPYTKALLSAIPIAKVGIERPKRIILQGEITSPVDPPEGCRFASRCIYAKEECFRKNPEVEEITPGHFVACHFTREINGLK